MSDSTHTRNADKDGALERSFTHEGCIVHRSLNVGEQVRGRVTGTIEGEVGVDGMYTIGMWMVC